jgi:hypothetical protein
MRTGMTFIMFLMPLWLLRRFVLNICIEYRAWGGEYMFKGLSS